MFAGIRVGWKKYKGEQIKTWYSSMRQLTISPSHIDKCRLPTWLSLPVVGNVRQYGSETITMVQIHLFTLCYKIHITFV